MAVSRPEQERERSPPNAMDCIRDALSTIKHGEIVIVIHDGRVVRVEKKDKVLISK